MDDGLISALAHMQSALDLLDSVDAPPHLGAQLDLTISRTREWLETVTNGPNGADLVDAEKPSLC